MHGPPGFPTNNEPLANCRQRGLKLTTDEPWDRGYRWDESTVLPRIEAGGFRTCQPRQRLPSPAVHFHKSCHCLHASSSFRVFTSEEPSFIMCASGHFTWLHTFMVVRPPFRSGIDNVTRKMPWPSSPSSPLLAKALALLSHSTSPSCMSRPEPRLPTGRTELSVSISL